MRALILLLTSAFALACPKGAPPGYVATPGQKTGTYNDKDKTVSLVVSCDERVKGEEALKALDHLGGRHKVNETVSYAEVKPGALRIYVGTASAPATQVAVVAKTPAALESANAVVTEYLKK